MLPNFGGSWFDAELVSLVQLIFFLALGFLAARAIIWSRGTVAPKAVAKKLDDDDWMPEEVHSCEPEAPAVKSKAASGPYERKKKNKKVKEVCADQPLQTNISEKDPVVATEVEHNEPPVEEVEAALPESAPEVVAMPEVTLVDSLVKTEKKMSEEKLAKMMAKKQERKAKKAQEQEAPVQELEAKPAKVAEVAMPAQEKPVVEATPVAKTAQVKPVVVEKPAQTKPVVVAKTAQAKPAAVAKQAKKAWAKPATEAAQAKPVAEPVVEAMPAQMASPVVAPRLPLRRVQSEGDINDTSHMPLPDEHPEDSDVYALNSCSPDGICTPEQCLTPRYSQPCSPCGMAQAPPMEGWVAVAVPVDCAPPGASRPFDGLWTNQGNERIVIEHDEILFESGMKWVIQMQTLTSLSVNVCGEEFRADLDAASQCLFWSDGDVWTCVGQTDSQQRWAAACEATGMAPTVFMPNTMAAPFDDQYFAMNGMTMEAPPAPMQNQQKPSTGKSWECCWDWSKKGWCSKYQKGECKWDHPAQQGQHFQKQKSSMGEAPFEEFFN